MVARRYLITLGRGVYAVGHRVLGESGRFLAAVLRAGPDAVLSHRSAAALWGFHRAGRQIEVTRRSPGRFPDTRLHRCTLPSSQRTVHTSIPVTTVPRTLVDLAGMVSESRLQSAIVRADKQGLIRWNDLAAVVRSAAGRPGIEILRDLLHRADPTAIYTESDLEARFLALCAEVGLPPPAVGVTIAGRVADFVWTEAGLIVETDGRGTHGDAFAFEDDRDRDGLMLESGYRTLRVTHRMLDERPEAVAARVGRLLSARSG